MNENLFFSLRNGDSENFAYFSAENAINFSKWEMNRKTLRERIKSDHHFLLLLVQILSFLQPAVVKTGWRRKYRQDLRNEGKFAIIACKYKGEKR